jgi:ABC-2 type transport system ATP-binding protein
MKTASREILGMKTSLPTELTEGPFDVRTDQLVKRFGAETVLHGVSLQVPEGGVYVLVGPNGAGKSTTFKILMDLLRADDGSATVLGLDPRTDGPRVRARIGYVPERFEWGYPWMRVGQLLEHHSAYFPSWDREYAARLVRLFDLRPDRRFASLSKGQTRRVHLTMALAHRPPLLVLDEPTDGLDPVMLDDTLGLLADHIAATPTTLLLSTHQVHDVDRLADHVGVMRDGRIILQAPRDVLRRSLLQYRVEAPEPWLGTPDLGVAVLRRESLGREMRWRIWGEEADVVERFARAGATVRDVTSLTLAEASLTLLRRGGEA